MSKHQKTVNGQLSGCPHHRNRNAASLPADEQVLKRSLRKLLPVVICALAVFPAGRVAAQSPSRDDGQQLKGHLRPEIATAPPVRRVPPTTRLTLTVGLALSNRAMLAQTAADIADPNSPSYRQYLTPEQFADQFGALPADYQSLLDWAQSNNLTATPHRNRFVATVEGAVSDIESALNVHMLYRRRADGTEFFAPDTEPSLKLTVPVEHIGGLDNFVRPLAAGGSGPGCCGGYQGADFRNAYAPGMTLTGKGQNIGIFMLNQGFAQSDINGYASQTGLSFKTVQVVPAGTALTPGLESTMDIEAALSMAPDAQVIAFESDEHSILAYMADRPDVKQLSSSWFWYDGNATDEALMTQLATQGQSFFQASGDGGAYPVKQFSGAKCVSGATDDRAFPSITIVGGTALNMSGSGASYGTLETAWSPKSSGGWIECKSLPSYQVSIEGQNGASINYRNAPDVSAQAQDIRLFWSGSSSDGWWGTSLATPLWAGYMALVNELAANYGAPSVGFANPTLYAIASTSAYNTDFHDIVSGSNPDGKGDVYYAGTGYDLVTGLGSPQHSLIYDLSDVHSFPLYCQGPLTTSSGLTAFQWASKPAGTASPGPGQCAWANRLPTPAESKCCGVNAISGPLHQVANLPAGKFGEIGVYRDPTTSFMVVTQIVGFVTPPFSSSDKLP
jgi:subtilase family serine protease